MASGARSAALVAKTAAESASAIAADEAAEKAAHAAVRERRGLDSETRADALIADWVSRAAPFVRVLADPTRLEIVVHLHDKEAMDVSALTKKLGLGQGTVSEALGRLKRERIVFPLRAGKRIEYRLNAGFFGWKLKQILDRLKGKK